MLRFVILSLALIALINSSNIPRTTATPPARFQNDKTFVQTACNLTTYPTMCYNALSPYSSTIKSDPIKLCLTSLSVNLKSANSALPLVSRMLRKAKLDAPSPVDDRVRKMVRDLINSLHLVIDRITLGEKTHRLVLKKFIPVWEMVRSLEMLMKVYMNAPTKKAVSELSMTTSNTLAIIANYLPNN